MDLATLYDPRPDAPSLTIDRVLAGVTPNEVWTLLVDPIHAARIWFGSTLESDLRPGGFLKWTGTWEGRRFEDHAIILSCEKGIILDALYFSGFSGLEESAGTRLRLTIRLTGEDSGTRVCLEQQNFQDITARDHSVGAWNGILDIVSQGIPGIATAQGARP